MAARVDPSQFYDVDSSPQDPPRPAPPVGAGRVDPSQFFETRGFEDRPGPQTLGQEFGRGVKAGVNQLGMSLYGLADIAGTVLGSQNLRDYAMRGLEDAINQADMLAPTVGQAADIEDAGDFFTWAASAIGQQVPVLATMFGSGGIGGALAKASMRSGIRHGLTRAANRRLRRQFSIGGGVDDLAGGNIEGFVTSAAISPRQIATAVREQLDDPAMQRLLRQSFTRGAGKGAVNASFAIQAGDLQNQLKESGLDSPLTAIGGGAAAAVLDAAPVVFLIDRMFPGMDRALSKAFIADIAKTMGMQGALEGGTEAAQEMIMLASRAYHDPAMDITSPANRKQILNAAAAGALVGAITGGGGETISGTARRVRRGTEVSASQLVDYVRSRVDVGQRVMQEAVREADAGIPGFAELRQSAASIIREDVAPVLSAANERLRAGATAAREALGVENLGIDLASVASLLDEKVRQRVSPVVDEALKFMNRQMDVAREAARTLAADQRVKFFQDTIEKFKVDIKNFIDQRIKPAVQGAEEELTTEVQSRNFDDPDEDIDDTDPEDAGAERAAERVVLGDFESRAREFRNTKTGKVSTIPHRVRTRDDGAIPFATRGAARKAFEELRATHPELADSQYFIEQRGDGFVIEFADVGAAEELFTQLRINEGLEDARIDARGNPNEDRRIGVKRPGSDKVTRLSVPKLAMLGQDIVKREGGELPKNRAKAALRGLDTIVARMLDQGYQLNTQELNQKILFDDSGEPMQVWRALHRAKFVSEASPPPRVDPSSIPDSVPVFDRSLEGEAEIDPDTVKEEDADEVAIDEESPDAGARAAAAREARTRAQQERGTYYNRGGLGPRTEITATEESQNEASKRAPSRIGKKPLNMWYHGKHQVRVGFGVAKNLQEDVANLVTELLAIAGIKNRVFVVDKHGAQTLIEANHPAAENIKQAIIADKRGTIITGKMTDDVIIYLSDRTLIDKEDGDEDRARQVTAVVIAHEIGHLVSDIYYERLPEALKNQMYAAFLKFARENPDRKHSKKFEEWMANQFVAWAIRDREPSNAMERFFKQVGSVLRKMYQKLREQFGISETFTDFMEGILAIAAGRAQSTNPFAQHFLNEGVVGRVTFKPKVSNEENRDFDLEAELEPLRAGLQARANKILDDYPGVKQAATRTWDTMLWLHEQLTASLNGRLRRLGFEAANKLADMFNRTPGKERENPTYFNNVQLYQALFAREFNRVLNKLSDADKARVVKELISGNITSNEAAAISQNFEQIYNYMIGAGLPVEKIERYFPRVWDVEVVRENSEAILKKLTTLGLDPKQADLVLNYMVNVGDESSQANFKDTLMDLPFQGFLEKRNAILNDPFFNKFQSKDLDRTIERYMSSAVKRAEFNRYFGSDSRDGKWDPRAKIKEIVDEAKEQGATKEQISFMLEAVDAALGRHGREIPVGVRQAMSWVATYQNLRLLMFSTLAAFPDIVGPAIRSNDFKGAFKSLRDNWRQLMDKDSDLMAMGSTWGIVSDTLNQHVLTEHFDNHWYPERARQINEKFFRAIGLERWTNFVRAAALAVGRDYIKKASATGDEKGLRELGLSVSDVQSWIEAGEPTFGSVGFESGSDSSRKVAEALIQFVNESVMRPNASQRPLWASNPAFMLVFHLKSFMYAMHDTVLRRMYHNFKEAGTPWQKAYVVAMPAMMMLALTALGLELRELIQYKVFGKKAPTDSMGSVDYVGQLALRTGLFGVSQLAIDWESAEERGQLPVMAISGPTIQQISDAISDPASQTVPKAIPIVSQLPPVRQAIRDVTPL